MLLVDLLVLVVFCTFVLCLLFFFFLSLSLFLFFLLFCLSSGNELSTENENRLNSSFQSVVEGLCALVLGKESLYIQGYVCGFYIGFGF